MTWASFPLTLPLALLLPGAHPAQSVALACEPTGNRANLATRASPYDSVTVEVGGRQAKICYSRPSMRGRVILGELVPYDTLWRTGANDPTILHLPFPANLAGVALQPGKYSIYTIPGRERWTIVINASTTQGGLTRDEGQFRNDYTEAVRAQEVARPTVNAETLEQPVEKFTIRSELRGEEADLVLEWERTRVRVPLRARSAR